MQIIINLSKQKRVTLTKPSLKLSISSVPIEMVKKHKILGLVVDENLAWESHINSLCLTLSSLNGLLYRTRDFLSYEMI